MRKYRRLRLAALVLLVSASGSVLPAQGISREALLRAEDTRARGAGELRLLFQGVRVPAVRTAAIRALGRLERPEMVDTILPYLADTSATAVAAEALAQSLSTLPEPARRTAGDAARLRRVRTALIDRASAPGSPAARGAAARSLARLPYARAEDAREVETVLAGMISPARFDWQDLGLLEDVAASLHTLARARRTLGDPSQGAVGWLREAAVVYRAGPIGPPKVAPVRRLAWMALNAARQADTAMIRVAIGDDDALVRRQAVLALPNVPDSAFRRDILARARRDASYMVRLDWVAGHRMLSPSDCQPLLDATHDANPHVVLAAIDALGATCAAHGPVLARLARLIAEGPTQEVPRRAGQVSWHGLAHALVAWARVDPDTARVILRAHAGHPVWQVRMYAARGATLLRDTLVLNRLAFDSVGSVREVAITGLSTAVGHLADRVYVRALSSPDYHVVLAAARALRGAPLPDSVVPALVEALDRLSERGQQTSRDPRMELLARVDEMGSAAVAPILARRVNDVDERVANEAVRIARRLDPRLRIMASPRAATEPFTLVEGLLKLQVTMSDASGGGRFNILLNTESTPITVSRIVALARSGYYDGLTFHRVVANFVIQGGSPGMNEYVGVGPFMRDELGLGHHERGALGISTRGRDTGDAQWFINLVDNHRLDHDYTVFGLVSPADLPVVDGILEGDVIETVRVVEGRRVGG